MLVLPVSSVAANIGFLRAIRVVRVLRFYRFTRDEEFFFGTVSVGTLRVMKLLLTVLTIFFVAAGMFYSFEHRVNPEIGTFGDAFYFIVVAPSTVGFGDIVPVTEAGRWVTVAFQPDRRRVEGPMRPQTHRHPRRFQPDRRRVEGCRVLRRGRVPATSSRTVDGVRFRHTCYQTKNVGNAVFGHFSDWSANRATTAPVLLIKRWK